MLTFLIDPPMQLYIALGCLLAVLIAIWFLQRSRSSLIRVAAVFGILAVLLLCDKLFESPREETKRKILEISTATKAKNLDNAFKHVSEKFQYNEMDKKALYEKGKWAQALSMWNGIEVGDFDRGDFKQIDDERAQIGFDLWPSGYGLPDYRFYTKATFQKDSDGQYRLQTIEFHKNRDPNSPILHPENNH